MSGAGGSVLNYPTRRYSDFRLRLVALCLFAVALLGGASPVLAHPAVDVCAPFAQLDPQQEQRLLRHEMRSRFPASQVGLIDRLVFRTDDSGDITGPEFQPGPVPTIVVPARFLYHQCLGMIIQAYAQDYPPETFEGYIQRLDACLEGGGSAGACTETALRGFLAGSRTPWRTDGEKRDYETITRRLTYNAATFMLAHETAHLILRASLSRDQLAALEEEFEADLLAQLSLLSEGTIATGPLFALASASLVAGDQDWLPAGHASHACRIARTRALNKGVLPKARWLRKVGDPGAEAIDVEVMARELEAANQIRLVVRESDRDCQSYGQDRIDVVRADFDQIVSAVFSGREPLTPAPDNQALIAGLRNVTPGSPQGQRMRTIISVVLLADSRSVQTLVSKMQAGPIEQEDMRALLQKITDIAVLVEGDAIENVSAREWGDLLFLKALVGYVSSPKGSVIEDVNRRYVGEIEASMAFGDPAADLWQARLLGELGVLDADAFRQAIAGADRIRDHYVSATIMAGDCGRAQRYLDRQFEAQGWKPAGMPDFNDPAVCSMYRAQGVAKQQSALGWVSAPVSPE